MNDRTEFVSQLMTHILEGCQIPKVQVERAVGPVLGFFLADVLTATLEDDDSLSGQYIVLCPEFPLLKPVGKLSTNIDWLLYNETRRELVFLELKTDGGSFSDEQAVIYLQNKLKVEREGAAFLLKDLSIIEAASKSDKYANILKMIETRLPVAEEALATCHTLRVIYLLPAFMNESTRSLRHMDKVLSFGELASGIGGRFAEEWRVIHAALQQLDEAGSPKQKAKNSGGAAENYQGRLDFERVRALCRDQGAQVVVGFDGGEAALKAAGREYLQKRVFKWDNATGGSGVKQSANWIQGDRFIEIVEQIVAAQ